MAALLGAALAWIAAWQLNKYLRGWVVGAILDLGSRLRSSVHFFLYDAVKILLLLTGLMCVVGLARASLNLDRAR